MKYSIIIPTLNSIEYLKDCISSVISQDFSDYELIISDNLSEDGTLEYLSTLKHDNIKVIRPESKLPMTEHWEFALTHAKGEWIIFVGVDDGLMPYFFKLSEFLTSEANKKGIKVINSTRSYYFWEGCQDIYGDTSIYYIAKAFYSIRSSKKSIFNALVGIINYIEIPQMYTESIVHKDIVEEIKKKQAGYFFSSIPQDASGAATICSTIDKYIHSEIPLGWVGSSSKSLGTLDLTKKKDMEKAIFNTHSNRIKWNSNIFGDYIHNNINNFKLYLYASILNAYKTQSSFYKIIYNSNFFKKLVFSNIYRDITMIKAQSKYLTNFENLLKINNIHLNTIKRYRKLLPIKLFQNEEDKYQRKIANKKSISCYTKFTETKAKSLMEAWYIVDKLEKENNFIDDFIKG